MSDLDLERLGDVWRQQPDPKELEELRRTADTVRRRARLGEIVDVLTAVIVAGVVLVLVVRNPELETLVVGGGAIAMLLYSQIRQRRLREIEIRALTGTAEEMLDQSIARLEATMRRSRFQLIGVGPAFLLGIGLGYLANARATAEFLGWGGSDMWLAVVGTMAVILGAMAVHTTRLLRRSRKEMQRLIALRDAFRTERESTAPEH